MLNQVYNQSKHPEVLFDYFLIEDESWDEFKFKVDKRMEHELRQNDRNYRVTMEEYQRVFNPILGKVMHTCLVKVYRTVGGPRRKPGEIRR